MRPCVEMLLPRRAPSSRSEPGTGPASRSSKWAGGQSSCSGKEPPRQKRLEPERREFQRGGQAGGPHQMRGFFIYRRAGLCTQGGFAGNCQVTLVTAHTAEYMVVDVSRGTVQWHSVQIHYARCVPPHVASAQTASCTAWSRVFKRSHKQSATRCCAQNLAQAVGLGCYTRH